MCGYDHDKRDRDNQRPNEHHAQIVGKLACPGAPLPDLPDRIQGVFDFIDQEVGSKEQPSHADCTQDLQIEVVDEADDSFRELRAFLSERFHGLRKTGLELLMNPETFEYRERHGEKRHEGKASASVCRTDGVDLHCL